MPLGFDSETCKPLAGGSCPGGTADNSPAFQPQKCTPTGRGVFNRLVCAAKSGSFGSRQKPSISYGYWRTAESRFFSAEPMRKGLQTLDFCFEAESLTHFGGLFLIQRFCNKLCLRRRLERILKSSPKWVEYHPADLILVFLYVLIAGLPRVNKTHLL